jgi:hypothetical protein
MAAKAGYATTRISQATHLRLREMSKAEGKSMVVLLDEAVEVLRRQRFLEEVNAGYAALRADPAAWSSLEAERRSWDATLDDGLAVAEGRVPYGRPKEPRRRRRRR